jgi:hypothetical protein
VKGVLFTSVPIRIKDPSIADLCPSILALAELPVPEGLDGRNLFAAPAR